MGPSATAGPEATSPTDIQPMTRSPATLTLQFHPDWPHAGRTVIESMAADGVYRSQFATGISNGGLTAHPGGDRWRWESRLFRGKYDHAEATERPVYGAWNRKHDPHGGAIRFGSAYLDLNIAVCTTASTPSNASRTTARSVTDATCVVQCDGFTSRPTISCPRDPSTRTSASPRWPELPVTRMRSRGFTSATLSPAAEVDQTIYRSVEHLSGHAVLECNHPQ